MMNLSANEYATHLHESKEMIALAEMTNTLLNDVKFKQVILKGYLENEALRLVYLLSDLDEHSQEYRQTMDKLKRIGHFKDYFYGLINKGQLATDSLHEALLIPEDEII